MLLLALAAALVQNAPADAYRLCAGVEGDLARLACFDEAAGSDPVLVAGEAQRSAALTAQAERTAAERARLGQIAAGEAAALAKGRREAAELEARAKEAEARLAVAEAREARQGSLPDQFEAEIVAKRLDPYGDLVFELDNGQVWRQISSGRAVPASRLDRVQLVSVRKGFLGSWWVTLQPLGQTIKASPEK